MHIVQVTQHYVKCSSTGHRSYLHVSINVVLFKIALGICFEINATSAEVEINFNNKETNRHWYSQLWTMISICHSNLRLRYTPNNQLLIITWRRCRETAWKRGVNISKKKVPHLSENSNENSLKYVTIMKQTKHNSYYGPGKSDKLVIYM